MIRSSRWAESKPLLSLLALADEVSNKSTYFAAVHESAVGRFCCKSLFALVIKISFGCTRDFRVNMWGTSLPEDKRAGDLGNVIGATSIGGRRSDFFTARKLAPGNLGLLQQYRHTASIRCSAKLRTRWERSGHAESVRKRVDLTKMTPKQTLDRGSVAKSPIYSLIYSLTDLVMRG